MPSEFQMNRRAISTNRMGLRVLGSRVKKPVVSSQAQSGIEYLMIIGFVTLAVSVVLLLAYFYIGISKDRIRDNQIEVLANKIINSAESVFFAGEPSQATVTIYMPGNVNKIEFLDKDLIITFSTSSGTSKRAFSSRVELSGNINPTEGYKKLLIKAEADKVSVTQKWK